MISASFIIPCKGRLDHLKKTISTKLLQHTHRLYEVIVVDYNCPDGTKQWCEEQRNPRLRVVSVPVKDEYFNNSHARNCGAREARGAVLCFSDADCFIHEKWLDHVLVSMEVYNAIGSGNDFSHGDDQLGRGTWAVKKYVWEQIRGYDESLINWGAEELDFFWRMKKYGKVIPFPRELCWTIKHDDSVRLQFYSEKNKQTSNRLNFERIRRRAKVNPNGFGLS